MAAITRTLTAYEILDEDSLTRIEHQAEVILEEVGMVFHDDDEVLDLWCRVSARIEGESVVGHSTCWQSVVRA